MIREGKTFIKGHVLSILAVYFTIVFILACKWLRPFVIYSNNNNNNSTVISATSHLGDSHSRRQNQLSDTSRSIRRQFFFSFECSRIATCLPPFYMGTYRFRAAVFSAFTTQY